MSLFLLRLICFLTYLLLCMLVYSYHEWRSLWHSFCSMLCSRSSPCLFLGDFNVVLRAHEKTGQSLILRTTTLRTFRLRVFFTHGLMAEALRVILSSASVVLFVLIAGLTPGLLSPAILSQDYMRIIICLLFQPLMTW